MTDRRFRRKLRRVKRNNEQWRRLAEVVEDGENYRPRRETSKALAVYLFVLLNTIVVYAMIAMWHFGDLSYLGVLITDIAGQVLVYKIYCDKAFRGKNAQENNKLEKYKFDKELKAKLGFVEDTEVSTEDEVC